MAGTEEQISRKQVGGESQGRAREMGKEAAEASYFRGAEYSACRDTAQKSAMANPAFAGDTPLHFL